MQDTCAFPQLIDAKDTASTELLGVTLPPLPQPDPACHPCPPTQSDLPAQHPTLSVTFPWLSPAPQHGPCAVHCSCNAGKVPGSPGSPAPSPALPCSWALAQGHRGAGTRLELWQSHQSPAAHTAPAQPLSLPIQPGAAPALCLLICSPHTLSPSSFTSCFPASWLFPHFCSRSHFILSTENTNSSTPNTSALPGWVCPGGYPGPVPAPVWPCPAALPGLQRALVTRYSALPLPPPRGQQEVTCDSAAEDAVLGTTKRNENAKTSEESRRLREPEGRAIPAGTKRTQPSFLPRELSTLPSPCPAQAPGRDTHIFLFKWITNYCLIH